MTKHACGSCKYFQEARESKQGWCTHPDRRETTAVRILVRAAELRCRNDWGADLWQERVDSDRVLDIVMNDSSSKPHSDSTARPIPAPAAVTRPIVFPATDVVEPVRVSDSEQAKLVSDNLNRELLRRAHDQARERVRNRGYSAELQIPRQTSAPEEREALVISNQYVPPSRQTETSADAPGIFEFNNKAGTAKFDERVVSSVPSALPESPQRAQVRQVEPVAYESGEAFDLGHVASSPHSRSSAEPVPGHTIDRTAWTEEELIPIPDSPQDWAEQTDSERSRRIRSHRSSDPSGRADRYEANPSVAALDSGANQSDQYDRRRGREFETFEDDDYSFAATDETESWSSAAPGRNSEGVWSGIVRTCQTCRDFRPAGNGQRGWCTNQWAFKHRRMVDAQDRPCETSIGHWWIPGDVAWQGSLDIAALGQPTPNVDKYLGRDDTPESMPLRRKRQS